MNLFFKYGLLLGITNAAYQDSFTCNIADDHDGWSEEKKAWCCEHEDVCPHQDRFDCTTGELWSEVKTKWCCSNRINCPNIGLSPDKFDCLTTEDWPERKEAWCCKYRRDCPNREVKYCDQLITVQNPRVFCGSVEDCLWRCKCREGQKMTVGAEGSRSAHAVCGENNGYREDSSNMLA